MPLPPLPLQHDWDVLAAIADHVSCYQTAPTVKEVAAALGLHTFAVHAHLHPLNRLGLLRMRRTGRSGVRTRSVYLTRRGHAALETFRAIQKATLWRGNSELVLTRRQMEKARAAELPVDVFPQSWRDGKIVLRCVDWQERNFWGEKILRVLV